ncbi:MAG: mannosyltransferase family protein [Blastocatellales bacterium]
MQSQLSDSAPGAREADDEIMRKPPVWRRLGLFWLRMRVLVSILAVLVSAQIPRVALEKEMTIWPPGAPVGGWLERVFLSPWERWDTVHYLKITARGYQADDGTSQFHPLYPWLGRVAGLLLGGNHLLGLLAVSSVCGLLFLICLERLAALDLERDEAYRTAFYFAHAPVAFILFAPYSESLFLLCSVIAFLMARRGSWLLAGLAGALAVLTRQQGIFLLAPLAWEFWEWLGRDWRKMLRGWRSALGLALVPLALLAWLLYRALALSDVTLDLSQPRTLFYGLLISQSAQQVVPRQDFMMPWQALRLAFGASNWATALDLIQGGVFLLLFVYGAKFLWRRRPSYLIYSVIILLVSFSYSTGFDKPYMGLPRHCLLAFPLFLPLAVAARRPVVHLLVILYALIGLPTLVFCYTANIIWLP